MTYFRLRHIFDDFDANRDGLLTLDEICEWMRRSGVQLSKEKLCSLVKRCDWNGDGRLDFDEFVVFNASLEEIGAIKGAEAEAAEEGEDKEGEMREAFRVFDKDDNGFISAAELRATLSDMGLIGAEEGEGGMKRIESMIRKVDSDGDGQVNFAEFESMLRMQQEEESGADPPPHPSP